MRRFQSTLMCLFVPVLVLSQQRDGQTNVLDLNALVDEVLRNNPEVRSVIHQSEAIRARVGQSGVLDDPELTYMREQMPGFQWGQAAMQKFELMQMIPFPSKLSKERELAEIQAEHSLHEQYEKVLDIVARLKTAYSELWLVQQSTALNSQHSRLLRQFVEIARTRFGTGEVPLQEVLKANVELAKIDNRSVALRQQEESAKAMLAAILNRRFDDTLGLAMLSDTVMFTSSLDSLEQLAIRSRPMLLHDSLVVEESRAMFSLSNRQYFPDFKLGVQYVTMPVGDFRGWSISAGITLPFAPWTLGKASSGVDEALATLSKSTAALNASRNMVLSSVRDSYFKARSALRQIESYRTTILPQARLSLKASMTAYQNGQTDFLMLIDAYRTLVDVSLESLMTRMQFELAVTALEREVGATGKDFHQ